MPTVTMEHSRTDRGLRLPSCFFSRLASVFSTLCIGLVSGAAGGLLLGATAVIVLQSLEHLADNRLLMDQLDSYIMDYNFPSKAEGKQGVSQRTSNDQVFNIYISLLLEEFGVFSATLSLGIGIITGCSTYKLVIEKYGETAAAKALALAGHTCLMCVTVTGYVQGLAFNGFVISTSSVSITTWHYVSEIFTLVHVFLFLGFRICCTPVAACIVFLTPLNAPVVTFFAFIVAFLLKTKLILMVVLIPAILFGAELENRHDFKITFAPVPLMLIITDVFNIARQPIVTLQPPASTNASSAVIEGIFVGVLITHLLVAAIGMSLFVSLQKGGAAKICAVAAGSGGAVLSVIKLVIPVLGPGPTIGALMGVTGAVGVSLSAAGAATDQYGLVGRLGVTVGAAVGAFLGSCAHSGLSALFMALCAATIPAGLYLYLFIHKHNMWGLFIWCLGTVTTIYVFLLLHFTFSVPRTEFGHFLGMGYTYMLLLWMIASMLGNESHIQINF